jgi:hypothetical protein
MFRLNKRVGFPSTTTSVGTSTSSEANKLNDAGAKSVARNVPPPPPVSSVMPKVPAQVPTTLQSTQEELLAAEVDVENVINILENCLTKAKESKKMDNKKAADISKRIGMLKDKWKRDQLNEKIHLGMSKLTKHLSEDEFQEAEKIQRALNVDYPSQCTPWMIGIRQLILAFQQ